MAQSDRRNRRKRPLRRAALPALALLATALTTAPGQAQQSTQPFAAWLEGVRSEAASLGISQRTIKSALTMREPLQRVIELDRKQPEFSQTFWGYFSRSVSTDRVEEGRRLLARHRSLLDRISRRYGVQPRFLVAFWGLETNFGSFLGGFPVIDSIATLAYDGRRGEFFRNELFEALRIVDEGHIQAGRMLGSWAGAMGQPQFLPSTFRKFAVDENGDGRRDIWGTLEDVFGSAANYLRDIGWRGDERWGREVRLPRGFDLSQADLDIRKSVREWAGLGVRRADGSALPSASLEASLIVPGGHKGPAFLVYENYRSILVWNRSILYGIAVGHLADRIAGAGPLVARPAPGERPLARHEVREMQERLARMGFSVGEADGVVGAQTRSAVKAFQQKVGMPADGYPTPIVLQKLRQSSG